MAKKKILVSACLLGENCKYDGKNNYCADAAALAEKYELIPICPECFGGLPTPRDPAEIRDGRVCTKNGEDVTKYFLDGAEKCLYIAEECFCDAAVLKERSPSCGLGQIYDGTFSSNLISGNGITAQLLYDNGIYIYNENSIKKLLDS